MQNSSQTLNSKETYESLAEILISRNGKVLNIEILPPGLGPIVRDGPNLGITKSVLVQSFLIARAIFFAASDSRGFPNKHLTSDLENEAESSTNQEATSNTDSRTAIATEVILLLDSEHLTACNWRKRNLCQLKELGLAFGRYLTALKAELTFTTTLLCSPLHRHAKSPTLWHHRYYAMTHILNVGAYQSTTPSKAETLAVLHDLFRTGEEALRQELLVVLRAAEQHYMNYYAFSYLRRFLYLLVCALASDPNLFDANISSSALQVHCIETKTELLDIDSYPHLIKPLAKHIVEDMHDWCLANPRDMSGWMFLFFLLSAVDEHPIQQLMVKKTVDFAIDIAWRKEALWTFVDLSTSKFRIDLDLPDKDGERRRSVGGTIFKPRGWKSWTIRTATSAGVHT